MKPSNSKYAGNASCNDFGKPSDDLSDDLGFFFEDFLLLDLELMEFLVFAFLVGAISVLSFNAEWISLGTSTILGWSDMVAEFSSQWQPSVWVTLVESDWASSGFKMMEVGILIMLL